MDRVVRTRAVVANDPDDDGVGSGDGADGESTTTDADKQGCASIRVPSQ